MGKDRLLVVDDEPAFAEFVGHVARDCSYEVQQLTDSRQLSPKLESWLPTHVILDLHMPEVDGFEALKILARDHRTAKVMICTGAPPELMRAAQRLGRMMGLEIVGCLTKPVRAAELRAHLDSIATPREVPATP